nr:pantoate--beta-alanine ligase [Micromonospora sp. DSM 115978]
MTEITRTRGELAAARGAAGPGRTGLVMTMGALHEGHEALLRAARARVEHLVATIFVNPLQFGPNEDLDRYPRTFEADLKICRAAGVDLLYAPEPDEVYPAGAPLVRVDPGPLGTQLEGASRPGFFHGVLTVVFKMFHLVRPELAFFGEKDYQQLVLVRRMVRDLDLDRELEIVGVPTVREPDGLALSSRNRYLAGPERQAALALSAALRAGAGAAAAGPAAVLAAAHRSFDPDVSGARLDYLVLTDPELRPDPVSGPARLLVAAWVGNTRLIDNLGLTLAEPTS